MFDPMSDVCTGYLTHINGAFRAIGKLDVSGAPKIYTLKG
jgi:hypothetical protein